MATLLKKITMKDIGCNPKVARDSCYAPGAKLADGNPDPRAGQKVPLAVIGGRATGRKTGENSRDGSVWSALTGSFIANCIQEGENFNNAEVYESGVCFLPGGVQEQIEGVLAGLGDGGSVEFAVEIMAGYDEKSATGYRYFGRNLKPATATDDLAMVRSILQPKAKALLGPGAEAGPKPEPVPAPAAETKPEPAPKSEPKAEGKPAAKKTA